MWPLRGAAECGGLPEMNNWFSDHLKSSDTGHAVIAYVVVVFLACLPIWYVDHFYGADGPPHLHSASLMLDLVAGKAPASGFYSFNSVIVPNSLGHWILALLLLVVGPATASKLMVSGLYCLFVAAVAWLRYSVSGGAGLVLVVLLAAVVGLNKIWLLGLYNFVIGATVVIAAFGLLVRWRGQLTSRRAIVMAVCFALAFFSHFISFGVLGLIAGIYILGAAGIRRIRSLGLLAMATVPTMPFAIAYQAMTAREAAMSPVWYFLTAPSISTLFLYLRSTDPLFIISRRYIPFLEVESPLTALASPILWIVLAIMSLVVFAWLRGGVETESRSRKPELLVAAVALLLTFVAPDELGSGEGSLIRPRFLLIAISLVIAVISIPRPVIVRTGVAALVAVVFAYQTAALWEYALRYEDEIAEFEPVIEKVTNGERLASVIVFDEQLRFFPSPIQRIGSLAAIGRDVVAWDTYEAGYYFFPVVAADPADRRALVGYSTANILRPLSPEVNFDVAFAQLSEQLNENHARIDVLMVRGRNDRVDALVKKWFGPEPFYETPRFRLFRRNSIVAR